MQLSWPFCCCPLRLGMEIFDEHEMQTVEVVGDFYTFKSHAQHPINPHTLTNQFKQVLRRLSESTRLALAWSVARRMRPFKGVGVGHGGYGAVCA